MSEVKENKEQNQQPQPIKTIVNQPLANILNTLTKFCNDNDNNRINEWSCSTLIGMIKNNCSEIVKIVNGATDEYKAEIKKLKEEIKNLEEKYRAMNVEEIVEEATKEPPISKESMAEVLKLQEKDKKDNKGKK